MSYALIDCKANKKIFKGISITEECEKVDINIPLFQDKKAYKYGKKISKILNKYNTNKVVLSNDLCNNAVLNNVISEKFNIFDGNRLYKVLIRKSINDICNIISIPVQILKVAIFVHEFSIDNLNLINTISKEVKQVCIVSENYLRYEKMLDDFEKEEGFAILKFDLQHKNFSNYLFVINVDFSEKELKRYNIAKKCIVFSISEKILKLKENFDGIIINDIDIFDFDYISNFKSLAVSEVKIYEYRRNFKENERRFEKSGLKINGYIGINGFITEDDFKRVIS